MDPDTRRRDPSWASSIPLIRSASRPPGFRNARHPLFLARPLLFTPPPPRAHRLTLFSIVGEEDTLPPFLPSLACSRSKARGWRRRDEDSGDGERTWSVSCKLWRGGSSIRGWSSRERSWFQFVRLEFESDWVFNIRSEDSDATKEW